MININSSEIEKELIYLKKLLKEYEENFILLFKELESSSLFWKDGKSELFFDVLPKEKIKCNNYYQELTNIEEIYTYILEQYKSIGNKVNVDLTYQESIISKFNKIINNLEYIKTLYEHLDISFCTEEKGIIIKEKSELENIIDLIKSEKKEIKKLLETIEKIELEITVKINSLKTTYIKEFEIDNYV